MLNSLLLPVLAGALFIADSGEELYKAKPFTGNNSFTDGIEGPACDANGFLYAVNFQKQQTIGRVTPAGKAEIFLTLPGTSTGNGIRFDKLGRMYIADYINHNILRVDMKTKKLTVFAHNDKMNQPNDLTFAANGTMYASDPNWKEGTGQLWKIDPNGQTQLLATNMGTTNGIDVSPDSKTLYVNESVQRNIWAFPIKKDGTLGPKKLFKKFNDFGFDGMRCDVDGNLYVTRHDKGTVVKISPTGTILKEIDILGKKPSNICFGGPDGRTAFVTEMEQGRLVTFRVEKPGLAWSRWRNQK